MPNKRRLMILIVIAISLALVNFFIVAYRNIHTQIKLKNLSPIEPWNEPRKPSKPRKNRIPQNKIEKAESPQIFLVLSDLQCKYISLGWLNLAKKIELDSVLPAGEILIEKASVKINGIHTYNLAKMKSNGRTVLISSAYNGKQGSYGKHPYTKLSDNFNRLNASEILISMHYYNGKKRYGSFQNELKRELLEIRENLVNRRTYKIIVVASANEKGVAYKLKGKILKDLLIYDLAINSIPPDEQNKFELRESLAINEKIPYVIRSRIMGDYLRNYFNRDKRNNPSKEKYFVFLKKLVTEYAYMPFSIEEKPEYDLDQHAVVALLDEYKESYEITAEEMIEFCDEIIAVTSNPKTRLRAYAAKTYGYLKINDFEKALEIAAEALKLYEMPVTQSSGEGMLNGQGAFFCLKYMMTAGFPPEAIFEQLAEYNAMAANLPEFQNNLLFIKAILTDLTASTLEEAKAAYAQVKYSVIDELSNVSWFDYSYGMSHIHTAKAAIKILNNQVRDKVKMEKPFPARKYLLGKDEVILNETGTCEVIIIQHELPGIIKVIFGIEAVPWKKAEIGEEIYWIKTEEENLNYFVY